MKHRILYTAAVWCVMGCLIAGGFLMAVSEKTDRLSETENRMLQGMPELTVKNVFNDSFMTGFEGFLSDNFFARDDVIAASDRALDAFSMLSEDDIMAMEAEKMEADLQTGNLRVDGGETDETGPAEADIDEAMEALPGMMVMEVEDAEDAEEAEMQVEADDPVGEKVVTLPKGKLPISSKLSHLYFKMKNGSVKIQYDYEKDKIKTYSETLRMIRDSLPRDGQVVFTQVPLASIANRWVYQQDEYVGWGSTVEMMLEDCLKGAERIHVFNTYEILEPYVTGKTPMFYHTDHHWSAEGAYLVYREMMKELGMPVIPYDEYDYKAIRSRKTTGGRKDTFNALYPLLPAQNLVVTSPGKYKQRDLMNYDSKSYLVFMNNTQLPWRRVITGANSGRNALVLCDSFGNAFTPYLLGHYTEVHMADFRYGSYDKNKVGGSISKMIKKYDIDDVYIITSTANGLRKDNSIVYLRKYFK